jgi:hypothetical protein
MKKISKKTGLLATKLGYKDREDNWVFYDKQYKTWFSTNVKGGLSGDEDGSGHGSGSGSGSGYGNGF